VSWASAAALFVLKTVAKPALDKTGELVGEAVGKRIAERIKPPQPDVPSKKEPPCPKP
jgi:hypothetical protein